MCIVIFLILVLICLSSTMKKFLGNVFNSIYNIKGIFHVIIIDSEWLKHCVKGVQIWSFFWSVFSHKWTDLLRKSPFSGRIRENTDRKKLRVWTLFTQWKLSLKYCSIWSCVKPEASTFGQYLGRWTKSFCILGYLASLAFLGQILLYTFSDILLPAFDFRKYCWIKSCKYWVTLNRSEFWCVR